MNELDAIQASLDNFTKRLDEVSNHRFNELRKCSFFDPVPSEWLTPISEQTVIKTFSAGNRLTSEGDDMDVFYVILFGTATAYFNKKIVGTIRSGECIGEGMFFANENISRSATVIADGQVIVAEIRRSGVDQLRGESKAYMDKALLLALFKKLQGANRKIEELLR
ncbi:MAG: cyclic nucleotide-binding domain-containing protein [Gammaproteobacteria bacterium]|nr:cyclic nucleotide-binding domain-containing protein [Gammaproteobacteria bacterium]MBU1777736.1 cyclic nucleotide-binding domain-containing protein [Gammaproteobacteria bacterium]MBU1967754.1 cyclic nucleotide-binding domain-containing protein [Gammaproteobacteria bacterium]